MANKLVIAMVPVAALTIAVVAGTLGFRAMGDRRSATEARGETPAAVDHGRQPPSPPRLPPRAVKDPPPAPGAAAAAVKSPAAVRAADAGAASDALMDTLRALAGKDPEQILRLARAANARDPDGPHAPERAWMVAKSLTDLGRFSEAKDEAQTMVNRYPGTSWALDLQRHLLSNPL